MVKLANRLLIAAWIVALAPSVRAQASDSESAKARRLLMMTLARTYAHNVFAIISQRTCEESDSFQQIQVQISRSGKYRQTILQPLSAAGVEKVDDGEHSRTYLPDQRTLIIQESPRLQPDDADERMALADKNYRMRLDRKVNVAGKNATIVIATPNSPDLETRRYYIDEKTGFLLRLETSPANDEPRVQFTTKSISYPRSIPESVFDLTATGAERVLTYVHRPNPKDPAHAQRLLGFVPSIPDSLPYGFAVQELQMNAGDEEESKSLAVRITDGLVKATVYEYPSYGHRVPGEMPGTSAQRAGSLILVIVGDMPVGARKALLRSFAARRTSEIQPAAPVDAGQELVNGVETLSRIESSKRELSKGRKDSAPSKPRLAAATGGTARVDLPAFRTEDTIGKE